MNERPDQERPRCGGQVRFFRGRVRVPRCGDRIDVRSEEEEIDENVDDLEEDTILPTRSVVAWHCKGKGVDRTSTATRLL